MLSRVSGSRSPPALRVHVRPAGDRTAAPRQLSGRGARCGVEEMRDEKSKRDTWHFSGHSIRFYDINGSGVDIKITSSERERFKIPIRN
jgi:hypothetical protein